MRTDGKFTLHKKTVDVKNDKPIFLIPFGDVHHDSQHCARDVWDRFISYLKTERKNLILLGMGDYLDFMRCHDRAASLDIKKSGMDVVRDLLNNYAEKELYSFKQEVWPFRKHFIGLISGNHYFEFGNGIAHSDERLANELGVPYLGVCCGITLTLRSKTGSASIRIIAHHGTGAATTLGGGLNRVHRFLYGWDADIALMGDNHQRSLSSTGDKLSFNHGKLNSRCQWIARTGSFLRGYVEDKSSYVTDAALSPSSLGWVEFELRLVKDQNGKHTIKIRGIQ
jgi:hypothetical protein